MHRRQHPCYPKCKTIRDHAAPGGINAFLHVLHRLMSSGFDSLSSNPKPLDR